MPKRSLSSTVREEAGTGGGPGSAAAPHHEPTLGTPLLRPARRLRSSSGSPTPTGALQQAAAVSPLKASLRKRPAPAGPLQQHPGSGAGAGLAAAISPPPSSLMLAPAGSRGRKRRAADTALAHNSTSPVSSSQATGSGGGGGSNRRRRRPSAWRDGERGEGQQRGREHHTLKSDHLPPISLDSPDASQSKDGRYTFAGEEDASSDEGEGEICDAQAVSINSGCLGGFPIGVGCAVSGEGGLAFAVQSEATSPGTGELILTGKIGKSMAESCMVALSWVKAKTRDIAAWMGLHQVVVDLHRPDLDVHVNFPSCEAEKNGPSAGATVATSLVLLMSGARLRPNVAISGEINLRGFLLPIGNVKEKVAAASRQGITHIVLPSANIKQFRRLPAKCRNAVKALKADHMLEVIKHAVEPPAAGGFRPEFEAAVKDHAGMGITASLACSHVKGKVQWVECCATTGKGEWHITGNVQEGTRGSVIVARTWVRKNAPEIMARLRMRGLAPRVELCSMRGLGREWQALSPLASQRARERDDAALHEPHHAHHDRPHHSLPQARAGSVSAVSAALPSLLGAAALATFRGNPPPSCSSASAASAATAALAANGSGSSGGSGGSSGSGTSSCCSSPARGGAAARRGHTHGGGKGGGHGGGGDPMQQDLGGDAELGGLGLGLGMGVPLAIGVDPLLPSSSLPLPAACAPLLDVHVHLPETEVAKDVSINGAAAAVSMIAVMTGLAVRPDVAVLGEITLAGVLWPLEQVNEAEVKTAIDARISHLILPMDNVRQIEKVPKEMRKGLRVTGAVRLMDVIEQLFVLGGAGGGSEDEEDEEDEDGEGEEDDDEEDGEEGSAAVAAAGGAAAVGGKGAEGGSGDGSGALAMATDSGAAGGKGKSGGEGGGLAATSNAKGGGGGKSEK